MKGNIDNNKNDSSSSIENVQEQQHDRQQSQSQSDHSKKIRISRKERKSIKRKRSQVTTSSIVISSDAYCKSEKGSNDECSDIKSNNNNNNNNSTNNNEKKRKKSYNKLIQQQQQLQQQEKEQEQTSTINSTDTNSCTKEIETIETIDYRANYIPTPIPKTYNKSLNDNNTTPGTKIGNNDEDDFDTPITTATSTSTSTSNSLGKWFPKAVIIKSSIFYDNNKNCINYTTRGQPPYPIVQYQKQHNIEVTTTTTTVTHKLTNSTKPASSSLVLFYYYVSPLWTIQKVDKLFQYIQLVISKYRTNIGGRIRIAQEGVNCTISSVDYYYSNNTTNDGDSNDTTNYSYKVLACETIRHFIYDLQQFDSTTFSNIDYKYIDNLSPDRHFKDCKIIPVQELVYYGINELHAPIDKTGIHLSPQQFRNMLLYGTINTVPDANAETTRESTTVQVSADNNKDDKEESTKASYSTNANTNNVETIVIDVRNHYEAAIGRFDGQEYQTQLQALTTNNDDECSKKQQTTDKTITSQQETVCNNNDNTDLATTGTSSSSTTHIAHATYIDPKMRKSTDFVSWISKSDTKELLKNKNVLLYCTGGVRCERASAYINTTLGSYVNNVYQLQGGIEKFLQSYPDGGQCWRGKNFVFDKREAISCTNRNGDGGIVTNTNTNTNTSANTSTTTTIPSTLNDTLVAANETKNDQSGTNTDNNTTTTTSVEAENEKSTTTTKSKKKKKKRKRTDEIDTNITTSSIITTYCSICTKPWDRYIGKKKCTTCGVPVLVCEQCLSQKKDNIISNTSTSTTKNRRTASGTGTGTGISIGNGSNTMKISITMRCPLCVQEDVTIAASNVVYTKNGVETKSIFDIPNNNNNCNTNTNTISQHKKFYNDDDNEISYNNNNNNDCQVNTDCEIIPTTNKKKQKNRSTNESVGQQDTQQQAKAATTVCKWGGGYANEKKFQRMVSRKVCRYGTNCIRNDCLFFHPSNSKSTTTTSSN